MFHLGRALVDAIPIADVIDRHRVERAASTGDKTFGIKSKGRRGARARSRMMMRALGQEL